MADLREAQFPHAQLQGASLDFAQLQGASLDRADLQGASLVKAQLQGASLMGAQVQGASLDYAQLQGASLGSVQLQGASLEYVFVWRADARNSIWKNTRVVNPEAGPKQSSDSESQGVLKLIAGQVPESKQWSIESFEKLIKIIAERVTEGDMRRDAMEKIEHRLDPAKALEGEDEMAKVQEDQARSSPSSELYEKSLVEIWRETGCAAGGAPYVLRGLLRNLEGWPPPFNKQSPQLPELAKTFLDEEHCPGAHGLTEVEKAKLKEIRDRPSAPAPKK